MELRLVSSSKKGAQTQLKLKKIRLGPPLKRFQFQKTIPAIFFSEIAISLSAQNI